MPQYLLDTNIASAIVRGPGPTLAACMVRVPATSISVSSVTQGELLYGLARKPGARNLHIVVREFLARVTVLPWDSAAATHYGVLRAALEARGTPLGSLDTLIAAHALAIGGVLVTDDRAFAQVPGLVVENWITP